jgi:N6-adenosine-specific RNA methylase IME4
MSNLVLKFPTAPAALKKLNELRREVRTAKTMVDLARILNASEALRRAFRPLHEVANRAGEVSIAAEKRLGAELKKLPVAKGTQGQLRGAKPGKRGRRGVITGGAVVEPPVKGPTLAELGVTKKRSARSKRLADIPEDKLNEHVENLKAQGKSVTPENVLAAQRAENKQTKKHAVSTAVFSADGPFGTAVIDWPWKMEKIDRDVRPNQDAFDDDRMTIDEMVAFWQNELEPRLAPDCHLFMWTTQKFLPDALDLIKRFGFRYVFEMVWHKPGGFQPIDLPQYNCEFIIYGRRGSPVFVDTKQFDCCFAAPRREHSRKPDFFYDTIRRVTGGSRIDVFSREPREGFAQYGNEIGKFAA